MSPRTRRPRGEDDGLNGPAYASTIVVPDLGLSDQKMAMIDYRLRIIQKDCNPRSDDPNALFKSFYALLEAVLDGENPPTCKRLDATEYGPPLARHKDATRTKI